MTALMIHNCLTRATLLNFHQEQGDAQILAFRIKQEYSFMHTLAYAETPAEPKRERESVERKRDIWLTLSNISRIFRRSSGSCTELE